MPVKYNFLEDSILLNQCEQEGTDLKQIHTRLYMSGAYPRGGHLGHVPPPLELNAQRKNLRRLKDLRGQIQQKSPKFSK